MNRSKYSAASSLHGYLYQCRLALLETLKRLKTNPNLTVAIETLDDVVFETDGTPTEIIQVKHHINRQANLTDASTDLWKTIRIWCDLHREGIVKSSTALCMMTTSMAPEGSAASYLRVDDRNVAEAERLLLQTAQTSVSETNKDGYLSFCDLTQESRRELLESAFILDHCPLNQDIDQLLQEEIWTACHRSKIDNFLIYLEGWWLKRILKSLSSDTSMHILGEELDCRLDELREQFKSDALPIHDDLKTATVDHELYQKHTFVHQLKLIEVGKKRIAIAVNNYYRAFVREDLGNDAAEREKVKAARTVYDWVEKEADIPIRPRSHDLFITRGSYHILSDRQEVGWHPEFRTRLEHLLEGKGAAE
jgi:hypothetical protein